MPEFKFALGDKVKLDPSGGKYPFVSVGLVIGQTRYVDGSHGYVVSVTNRHHEGLSRHQVYECELQPVTEEEE